MTNRQEASATKFRTQSIQIAGMTCDHCSKRVEKALRSQAGVADVSVDRSAGIATVTYDPTKIDPVSLRVAIVKSGYQADLPSS